MHDTADHIGSHFYTQPPAPKMTNKYPPVVGPYSIDDHLHVFYTLNPRHLGGEGVRWVDISQTRWPLRNQQTRICTSWTRKFRRVHRCHLKSQDWVWVRRRTDRGLVLRSAQSPRRVSTQVAACMCRRSRLLPYIHIRTYTQKHTSRTCMHGIHRYTHAYVNTCTCIYRGVEVGVGGTVQYSTLGAHIHSTQTYIRVRAHIHTDAKYMHTHAYIHT